MATKRKQETLPGTHEITNEMIRYGGDTLLAEVQMFFKQNNNSQENNN